MPITLAGILLALVLILIDRPHGPHASRFSFAILAFYTYLALCEAVKVALYAKIETRDPATKQYPTSDKVSRDIVAKDEADGSLR